MPLEDKAVDSDRENNQSTAGSDNGDAAGDNNNDDGGNKDTTIAGYSIPCIDQQTRQNEFICDLDDKTLDD